MPGYRKFLTVSAYSYDENGRVREVDKFINDWDVHTEDLINNISLEDIAGIEELELKKYLKGREVIIAF